MHPFFCKDGIRWRTAGAAFGGKQLYENGGCGSVGKILSVSVVPDGGECDCNENLRCLHRPAPKVSVLPAPSILLKRQWERNNHSGQFPYDHRSNRPPGAYGRALRGTSRDLLNRGGEDHINPVVARTRGAGGKRVAGRRGAIGTVLAVGRGIKQPVRDARGGEVPGIIGVVSTRRPVRDDIGGIGVDSDRRSEIRLLPSRGRFIREGDRGEQSTGASPKVAKMLAGIRGTFIISYAGDVAGNPPEMNFRPRLCSLRARRGGRVRNLFRSPQRNWTGRADRGRRIEDWINPEIRGRIARSGKATGAVSVHAIGSHSFARPANPRSGALPGAFVKKPLSAA